MSLADGNGYEAFGGIDRGRQCWFYQRAAPVGGDYIHNGFKVGPNYCPPCGRCPITGSTTSDPNVSSEPPNDAAWWRTFNDPVLDCLVQTAYRQNLTLRMAGCRILEARAQQASPPATSSRNPSRPLATTCGANLARTLPTPFRAELRRMDRRASILPGNWISGAGFAAAWSRPTPRWTPRSTTTTTCLVLLLAEVATALRRTFAPPSSGWSTRGRTSRTRRESLHLAEVKFHNGATTRLDVTQGQSNLVADRSDDSALGGDPPPGGQSALHLDGACRRETSRRSLGARTIPSALADGCGRAFPPICLRRRPDVPPRRTPSRRPKRADRRGRVPSCIPHFSITGTIFYDAQRSRTFSIRTPSPAASGRRSAGTSSTTDGWSTASALQDARFQQLVLQYQNTVLQANAEAENAMVGFLQAQQQVKYLATSAAGRRAIARPGSASNTTKARPISIGC